VSNTRPQLGNPGCICAVTGASGYVGARIVDFFRTAGFQTLRLGRDRQRDDRYFELGTVIGPALLHGVDVLVHCAYDPRARTAIEDERVNVRGSQLLLDAARQAGVRRIIFISTVSAFEKCLSFYGRGKYAVEQVVLAMNGVVLRPGLVYGGSERGMLGTLCRLARLPVLPVFDGGKQEFVLVHVDDLARCAVEAASWDVAFTRKPVVVANREMVQFKTLLELLAISQGRKLRTFSIPGRMALLLLRVLERAGLKIRFRSDSLVSMLNLNPQLDFSVGEKLGLHFRSITGHNFRPCSRP
jgi:nucleoside-diphosphate-sugar epimerase